MTRSCGPINDFAFLRIRIGMGELSVHQEISHNDTLRILLCIVCYILLTIFSVCFYRSIEIAFERFIPLNVDSNISCNLNDWIHIAKNMCKQFNFMVF